jgi:nitroreductase
VFKGGLFSLFKFIDKRAEVKLIRRIFPALFPSYNIILGELYDLKRFISYNTNNDYRRNREKHEAIITRISHGIEKAFSLPNVRLFFGVESCKKLILELEVYYKSYGYNELIQASIDVLAHYKNFHNDHQRTSLIHLFSLIDDLIVKIPEYSFDIEIGGTLKISKNKIEAMNSRNDFKSFCHMRYSVRDFQFKPVSDDLVSNAIEIAIKTPSVCNRQAWKVYLYRDDNAQEILKYQNGSASFKTSIQTVVLITGTLTSFSNNERNQVFIDGGLFSMSLIYAFHSLSLGVCPLNTAYFAKDEALLHNKMKIPNSEVPIMMLAIGHLKDEFLVAKSRRKQVKEILVVCD